MKIIKILVVGTLLLATSSAQAQWGVGVNNESTWEIRYIPRELRIIPGIRYNGYDPAFWRVGPKVLFPIIRTGGNTGGNSESKVRLFLSLGSEINYVRFLDELGIRVEGDGVAASLDGEVSVVFSHISIGLEVGGPWGMWTRDKETGVRSSTYGWASETPIRWGVKFNF